MIKTVLSGLFKFRIELFQFMDKLCFLKGMTPVLKLLIKTVVVPYVICLFGAMYLVYRWVQILKGSHKSPTAAHKEEEDPNAPQKRTFSTRLSQGFVLCLLFTYQKLASTSFTLLNCVPVGDESVLFIEGTVSCYQMWQYGVIGYTVICIVPFCLTLLIGPGLMKDGLISLPQFFVGCIVPLPFFLYWITVRLTRKPRSTGTTGSSSSSSPAVELSSEAQAVIAILQGPFKETETKFLGPTCGQGVLIGRRLVLVIIGTFITDPLIRMLLMMLVCFIILLHHVHVLPYKDTKGNAAGSMSAAALLVVGGINLVRAGFEAAEYEPQGPNHTLMKVFQEVENTLMLWFPLAIMSIVFAALFFKLFLLFLKWALTSGGRHISESPSTEVTAL